MVVGRLKILCGPLCDTSDTSGLDMFDVFGCQGQNPGNLG